MPFYVHTLKEYYLIQYSSVQNKHVCEAGCNFNISSLWVTKEVLLHVFGSSVIICGPEIFSLLPTIITIIIFAIIYY